MFVGVTCNYRHNKKIDTMLEAEPVMLCTDIIRDGRPALNVQRLYKYGSGTCGLRKPESQEAFFSYQPRRAAVIRGTTLWVWGNWWLVCEFFFTLVAFLYISFDVLYVVLYTCPCTQSLENQPVFSPSATSPSEVRARWARLFVDDGARVPRWPSCAYRATIFYSSTHCFSYSYCNDCHYMHLTTCANTLCCELCTTCLFRPERKENTAHGKVLCCWYLLSYSMRSHTNFLKYYYWIIKKREKAKQLSFISLGVYGKQTHYLVH